MSNTPDPSDDKTVKPNKLGEFPCGQCGSKLTYEPGTSTVKCQYCGHANEIEATADDGTAMVEHDFHTALSDLQSAAPIEENKTIKCDACAAEFSWDPNVHADNCPFCGSPIVADPKASRHIQPQAVVPFQLKQNEAQEKLKGWLGKLWFAPNDVKRYAYTQGKLVGMYVPYWTFDTQTYSDYRGERGDSYTESYETTDRDGNSVTESRTRIDWTPVSGHVQRFFDDVLIVGSKTLPKKYADRLDEWDLSSLVPYQQQYLSGYRSEVYQVELEEGFVEAKQRIDAIISQDVRYDIGGDQQRVHDIDSQYEAITYKHILLPVWMNAYRYGGKSYHFLVNGQTGEVEGQRPWSWIKISIAVLVTLIILGAIIYFVAQSQ
jgi:LSD1 subclass zinc finger protein